MRTLDICEYSQISGGGFGSKLTRHVRYQKMGILEGGYILYKDKIGAYWAGTPHRPRQCRIPDDKIVQVKLSHSVEGICPPLA